MLRTTAATPASSPTPPWAVTQNDQYDAYGNQTTSNSSLSTHYLSDGTIDPVSGLTFHFGGRESYTTTGRFIEQDSQEYTVQNKTSTTNRYVLDADNPVENRDPSGHLIEELFFDVAVFMMRFAIRVAPLVTAAAKIFGVLSLIMFFADPEFRESIIASTGGDPSQLGEIFEGSLTYFGSKAINFADALATAKFVSRFAPRSPKLIQPMVKEAAIVMDSQSLYKFLENLGWNSTKARDYANSFPNGMASLRLVKPGEQFLRYSGPEQAETGSFLGKVFYFTLARRKPT